MEWWSTGLISEPPPRWQMKRTFHPCFVVSTAELGTRFCFILSVVSSRFCSISISTVEKCDSGFQLRNRHFITTRE